MSQAEPRTHGRGSSRVTVRLTIEEKMLLVAASAAEHLVLSAYLRRTAIAAAQIHPAVAGYFKERVRSYTGRPS